MKEKKLYNLSSLLQAVGNDKASLKEMVQIFLDTLPQALEDLHKNIEKGNWETVRSIAHSAKSNIDMIQVKSSFVKIKEIETLASEAKETDKIPLLLKEIEKEMNVVFEGLKEELK